MHERVRAIPAAPGWQEQRSLAPRHPPPWPGMLAPLRARVLRYAVRCGVPKIFGNS